MVYCTLLATAFALFAAPARAQQCTSPTQTIALCCESLGKFSDNSYVWTGVCGKTGVAPDTPTASFCGAPGTCYDNIIPVCCESTFGEDLFEAIV
ncbi:unnamed protein product [Peniophora sp. CBMAI 1063]|nr:unnamed protein product [Peniophora sp. CBMAI 1063]